MSSKRPDGCGGVTGGERTGGDLGGPRETDCVPGHIGFELANPSASYLIVIAWQLRLRWAQLGWQRHFACQLYDAHLELGPRFQLGLFVEAASHQDVFIDQSEPGGCSVTKGPLGSLAGWPLRRTAGSCSGSVHPLTHTLSRPLRSAINKRMFRTLI